MKSFGKTNLVSDALSRSFEANHARLLSRKRVTLLQLVRVERGLAVAQLQQNMKASGIMRGDSCV